MIKQIEIEKGKKDFKNLWLIKEIKFTTITLVKYDIHPGICIECTDKTNIILDDIIGTETHLATLDVIKELAGKSGTLIKGFETEKIKKNVKITKILYI